MQGITPAFFISADGLQHRLALNRQLNIKAIAFNQREDTLRINIGD